MTPRRAAPGAMVLLAALATPAAAQDRPLLQPQHDVDVLYHMAGSDLTQRLRWSEAARTLRVDPPGSDLHMLMDYAANRMQWVADGRREVMDLPAPTGPGALAGEGDGRYARAGSETVAGLACTDWRTSDAKGTPMTLCLTADGVLLQVQLRGQVVLQAASVSYAAQPPDAFRAPPDYRHVARPPAPAAAPPTAAPPAVPGSTP